MVVLMMVLKINGTSPDHLIAGSLTTRFYVFTPNAYLSQNLDAIQWLTVLSFTLQTVRSLWPPVCVGERSARDWQYVKYCSERCRRESKKKPQLEK